MAHIASVPSTLNDTAMKGSVLGQEASQAPPVVTCAQRHRGTHYVMLRTTTYTSSLDEYRCCRASRNRDNSS